MIKTCPNKAKVIALNKGIYEWNEESNRESFIKQTKECVEYCSFDIYGRIFCPILWTFRPGTSGQCNRLWLVLKQWCSKPRERSLKLWTLIRFWHSNLVYSVWSRWTYNCCSDQRSLCSTLSLPLKWRNDLCNLISLWKAYNDCSN